MKKMRKFWPPLCFLCLNNLYYYEHRVVPREEWSKSFILFKNFSPLSQIFEEAKKKEVLKII